MRTPLLHETLREWCIKFATLFAEELHHWLRRAVDEYGFVLEVLLQRHRDTEAAKTFLTRLLGEYDVPEVIHTD